MECWRCCRRAQEYRDATNGAFDITIAPIMDAWGFTGDQFRVPEQSELNDAVESMSTAMRSRCSGGRRPDSVTLGEGQAIDLGGIAKGYTSDWVEADLPWPTSIESGKISLGGNVFVLGTKPDGSDWRVGIKDPRNESGLAAILSLRDAYAITSGGYERYFEENGKTYHHIIDPATGYPADSGLLSVTVVADANGPDQEWVQPGNGTMCDAFSTALFVMGEEQALDFWRNGGYDFDLVLVTEDGRVVITAGLADRFEEVKDSGYTYETVS
ncbi:MAG: FAD:protein FMN transferase [Dysosmobacter sp.]